MIIVLLVRLTTDLALGSDYQGFFDERHGGMKYVNSVGVILETIVFNSTKTMAKRY